MRKSLISVALTAHMAFALGLTPADPASAKVSAAQDSANNALLVKLQQKYWGWLFGSATNPLLRERYCGEEVDGVLFLNAAAQPNFEATCTVTPETRIVGLPGGTIEWESSGATDEELLAHLAVDSAVVRDGAGTLDGRSLDREEIGFANASAYTIRIADGSFIKTVDPGAVGLSKIRVASSGWIVRLAPLTPGPHALVLSDTIDGTPFVATFHINVTRRPHDH